MVHDGEIRRSADSNGGELGEGFGTVIVRGMSGALWRDIPVDLVSVDFLEGWIYSVTLVRTYRSTSLK